MKTAGIVVIIKCLLNWKMLQVSSEDIKVGCEFTTSILYPAKT